MRQPKESEIQTQAVLSEFEAGGIDRAAALRRLIEIGNHPADADELLTIADTIGRIEHEDGSVSII